MRKPSSRSGISAVEVIVLVIIVLVIALGVLMSLPRQREAARSVACQRNLMRIGKALGAYEQARGQLPTADLNTGGTGFGRSPIGTMVAELGTADLLGTDAKKASSSPSAKSGKGAPMEFGIVCPADPHARDGIWRTPISYRATTGDAPGGLDGAFAPGRRILLADVAAGDGLAFTAAFAERLLGDGRSGSISPSNYAIVPGPVSASGCPPAPARAWRGDAGLSWAEPEWRATLYNHALTPNAAPSCIADDDRTALMGASSAHPGEVYVLMLDGSVRPFTPSINPKVWRMLANTNDRGSSTRD